MQVEVENIINNTVPLFRFVEYMRKAITERRYISMKSFLIDIKNLLYYYKYFIYNLFNISRFKPAEAEELLKAFQLLDPENYGYIMRDDLEKLIMEIGEPFTKKEVSDMMAVACDETGKINYEHYINLLIVCKSRFTFNIVMINLL